MRLAVHRLTGRSRALGRPSRRHSRGYSSHQQERASLAVMAIDLGDVPTWLATLGAGVAAFYAYGAYKIESERDKRQSLLSQREQASKVAIWPEQLDNPHTGAPAEAECFWLRNASELPIHDARVFSYAFRKPESDDVTPESVYDLGIVGPTGSALRRFVKISPRDSYSYALSFRDAAGLVWHRTRMGALVEGDMDDSSFESRYLPDEGEVW